MYGLSDSRDNHLKLILLLFTVVFTEVFPFMFALSEIVG